MLTDFICAHCKQPGYTESSRGMTHEGECRKEYHKTRNREARRRKMAGEPKPERGPRASQRRVVVVGDWRREYKRLVKQADAIAAKKGTRAA